jgi:hypothetical protein
VTDIDRATKIILEKKMARFAELQKQEVVLIKQDL